MVVILLGLIIIYCFLVTIFLMYLSRIKCDTALLKLAKVIVGLICIYLMSCLVFGLMAIVMFNHLVYIP